MFEYYTYTTVRPTCTRGRKRSISNCRDINREFKKQKQEELSTKHDDKIVLNGFATPTKKDKIEVKLKPFVSNPPSAASTNGVSIEHVSKAFINQKHDRIPESVHSNPVQQEIDLPPLPNQVESSQSCPRPTLKLSKSDKGLEVLWEFEDEYDEKLVKKYHLYSCNPSSKNGTVSWKKVGIIDSIKLPIKVTLSDFKSGTTYFFSVRGEDHNNGFGCYSEVEQIHL